MDSMEKKTRGLGWGRSTPDRDSLSTLRGAGLQTDQVDLSGPHSLLGVVVEGLSCGILRRLARRASAQCTARVQSSYRVALHVPRLRA
eukprot:6811933-Pyramimonas_sp.AAC.1